jgi:hypothetical protein
LTEFIDDGLILNGTNSAKALGMWRVYFQTAAFPFGRCGYDLLPSPLLWWCYSSGCSCGFFGWGPFVGAFAFAFVPLEEGEEGFLAVVRCNGFLGVILHHCCLPLGFARIL